MALSLRRANSVKNELVRQGVPADAIAVVGKGESSPLVATGDGVREPQNRRVEIVMDGAHGVDHHDLLGPAQLLQGAERQVAPVPHLPGRHAWKRRRSPSARRATTRRGIPTLENSLIANNIPLPAPGYRWPGRPIGPS